MDDIIEKAKSFIKEKGSDIIPKIYNDNYINQDTIDISSLMINYIKEKIVCQNMEKILLYLEDQYILTSLYNLYRRETGVVLAPDDKKLLEDDLIKNIKKIFLVNIDKLDDNLEGKYRPKFDFHFFIPGLYPFYVEISNYISFEISGDFSRNESSFRKLKKNVLEFKKKYYKKESQLLQNLYDHVENKIIFDLLTNLPLDLMLNEYITYYLIKYYLNKYKKDLPLSDLPFGNVFLQLINLILDIRFNDNCKIIETIKNEPIKILLLKIIWLESNINYLMKIIDIYLIFKDKFDSSDNLLNSMKKTKKDLKHIENEKNTSKYNKEVNECYYLILGSICLSILPNKEFEGNVEEKDYLDAMSNALKILDNLNNDLLLHLNEMHNIDEFIQIYKVFEENDIEMTWEEMGKICVCLRKNNEIIQSNAENKFQQLYDTLKELLDLINNRLEKDDKDYYKLLNCIYYKEIKKIDDFNYRMKVLEEILKEEELVINLNEILEILLKNIMVTSSIEKFEATYKLLDTKNNFLIWLEEKLDAHDVVGKELSEVLSHYFAKKSFVYLNNIIKYKDKKDKNKIIHLEDGGNNKDKIKDKKEDKLKDKKEDIIKNKEVKENIIGIPLTIFENCIEFLELSLKKVDRFNKYNKKIYKLFAINYIKSYCFIFISLINSKSTRLKDPIKIINSIKEFKKMEKIISLYIFKTIYYKNENQIDIFLKEDYIAKYELRQYSFYKNF